MSSALRQTVRVSADHSIIVHHAAWCPGEELEILVRAKAPQHSSYSFLDVLEDVALDTPADFSTSYEKIIKGEQA